MKRPLTTALSTFAFLMACLLCSPGAIAQEVYVLNGKVLNERDQPLEAATVSVYGGANAALIKTALSDSTGTFKFERLLAGTYTMRIAMIGYQRYESQAITLNTSMDLPQIKLTPSQTALKEVTVTAQRPLIERKIDRTVVNVEAMLSNAGGTALEVLQKSPGVNVDQNGAVSLKGKGTTVLIDDKPTYLSGADLENYLKSLPASSVDQIELIPNPPARYEAAGNGGIINIRTKKNKLRGFNGNLNLSYAQGQYGRTTNSFNYNYRNNKLNLTGSLSYGTANSFNDLDINRHFENSLGQPLTNFFQNSYIRRKANNYAARAGVDYYLSEKATLGFLVSGLTNPATRSTPVTSKFTNAANLLDSTVVAENEEKNAFRNVGMNLNYRYQSKASGNELTADVDYLTYSNRIDQSFDNNSYLPDGSKTASYLLKGALPTTIDIWSGKTDFTHDYKSGFRLGAGAKASFTKTDNTADYSYRLNSIMVPDYDKTNHFIYSENINALYLNLSRDFKRLSMQAGLRMENTISTGNQLGNVMKPDSTFNRNSTALFPTLFLQYKLDTTDRHQLTLNVGRRIDRPFFRDLNPFISPLDKFTFYTGNPFLKPSYSNSIELSHTFKNKFTTTFTYSRSDDQVNETIEIRNGKYYSRPGNIGRSTFKSVSFTGGLDPNTWFSLNFYGELSEIHTKTQFYTGPLDTRGAFVYLSPNVQFKLKKDWTFQLDGYYQSKVTNVQFIAGEQKRINAGVSKKLAASTTVKFVVNDVFYSFVNSGVINNLALTKANWTNLSDTRTAVLSISYRMGKAIANQRKHTADGAESERNRVKN